MTVSQDDRRGTGVDTQVAGQSQDHAADPGGTRRAPRGAPAAEAGTRPDDVRERGGAWS